MRRGELIASLAAMASASLAKLGPSQANLSALDRCTFVFRVFAAIAVSLVSFAHEAATQEPVHRTAVVTEFPRPPGTRSVLFDDLHAKGYEVGRNLQIDYRYTQGQLDRIPSLVAELLALHPDIFLVTGSDNAVAVHAKAPTIPLVFLLVADPVALGLVMNLAHPGGNVTGVTTTVPESFATKQLDLLKSILPAASRIAMLVNPTNNIHQREQLKFPDYARRLGVELVKVQATKPEELEAAFEKAHAKGVEAINVFADALTVKEAAKIATLALQYRWPSIYLFRSNVHDGGLMSYGPNFGELAHAGARQIDKILKGAKPGDLPVEQPTQFDLIISLKTAKALRITIPATLLVQAAEVIE